MKGKTNPYDTQKVRVSVLYSKGTCKENNSSIFNVPKGTVLTFMVSLKEPLNAREIIDKTLQSLEKAADPEMEGVFHYLSKDGSVKFETVLSNVFICQIKRKMF